MRPLKGQVVWDHQCTTPVTVFAFVGTTAGVVAVVRRDGWSSRLEEVPLHLLHVHDEALSEGDRHG